MLLFLDALTYVSKSVHARPVSTLIFMSSHVKSGYSLDDTDHVKEIMCVVNPDSSHEDGVPSRHVVLPEGHVLRCRSPAHLCKPDENRCLSKNRLYL